MEMTTFRCETRYLTNWARLESESEQSASHLMRDGMDVSARAALLTRTRECICTYHGRAVGHYKGGGLGIRTAEMQADCVLGIGRWDLPGCREPGRVNCGRFPLVPALPLVYIVRHWPLR